MNTLGVAFVLGLAICGSASLKAGTVALPTDVSVALTAVPSANLQPGDRITFQISVTNHGPEAVSRVVLVSSPIYNELDVSNASADCGNNLVLAVVDLQSSFYYLYTWAAATVESPLAVGETRNCFFRVDYTPEAPLAFPLAFGFPEWLFDLNPTNNLASVSLRRAVAVKSVPALSPAWLGLLILSLITAVWISRDRLTNPESFLTR
ncbi:MAG: hypothetical protein ABIQ70_06375 [Dokdonella sp.]